ncbi:PadR family transcriptional regulator [Bifidobacterium sp.]|jgi:PadR family transcriptional regulator PadR|uniref:PadR family transcriptional regulator n=1 Tax=Bifidobacterium sp. TaxID=41200 RepID=UPI0025C67B5A|nr:PadR family transcriptional regulator [Bifidobacterium sp.]MCH4208550.1 PadR family transcriptional regulator [Bifidobacterium sp.]MCI1224236.1 PadR family transcriptional regulator [Bifidobacterium sp.]
MISADALRGYVDIMILSLLRREPSYAYDMAKEIAREAEGDYSIKQTTLYSALKRLEGTGHVESFPGQSQSGKPRTYYRLTEAGHELLASKCEEWEQTKTLVDRFAKGND